MLGRSCDVDVDYLRNFFSTLTAQVEMRVKTNLLVDNVDRIIAEIVKEVTPSEDYYCYIFIFLTFLTFSGGTNILQFNSKTVQGALQSTPGLLNLVDRIPAIGDKPKIYLIQADDLSLAERRTDYKAAGSSASRRVLPLTGKNSLIALSTIPQKIVHGTSFEVSFLIRAFVRQFQGNNGQRDAASLMEDVKTEVSQMVSQSDHERKLDMPEVIVVND